MMPSMWPIEQCSGVASTHLLAVDRVRQGLATAPFVLVSCDQQAGVGQHGRQWVSCGDGLAMSLAWPERVDQAHHGLPFGALPPWPTWLALLVLQTLEPRLPVETAKGLALKWPNDLYCHGRKAGGVLVQRLNRGAQAWLVAGIGLNGRWRVPMPEGIQAMGLLEAADPALQVIDWVGPLVEAVAGLAMAPQLDAQALAQSYARWDAHLGAQILLVGAREQLEGRSEGVTPDGRLRLRLADGALVERALGEVSLRPAGCRP
jgi:BirA family biotin operon repressor/biotin-[acetyl-CoA-carboxylase] ligase